MAKMNEEDLLSLLVDKEEQAITYVHGTLASKREKAMREYFREPYGDEEEGWSSIVSSEVQDTIEWILPSLLKIFTASDEAVTFDPTGEEDVKAAKEATDACNYVFYKQNNGFLVLYTAFKDALLGGNCAVMWRKHTQESVKSQGYKGVSADQLTLMLQQQPDSQIERASEPYPAMGPNGPAIGPDGQPIALYDVRIKSTEKRQIIKIEAFEPENLLIERTWTSPLLEDCPYVARLMPGTTMSELREMGLKVDADEADEDNPSNASPDASYRASRSGIGTNDEPDTTDESQREVTLRIEYVLVDFDGDGIAERRCIWRLKDRILKNEVVSHVPIATGSPILITHRWDGMSMAEAVSDLMQLKTELLRQSLNSLYLANNPRTKVLTDSNWSPMANLEDLLDSRPGAILRQRDPNAIQEHVTPWVGQQTFPMLEYVDGMRENRTGVTRYNQGIDANSLNKTASGISQIMSASQQRIELVARILAETLIKTIFQGTLKELTDGGMDKLSFRLNNEFVQLDPNEWRDWYDMTINVGLGTGDKQQQAVHLQAIMQNQLGLMQMGLAGPKELYTTMSKMTENAGFKNIGDFWIDPTKNPTTPPAPILAQQLQSLQQQMQQLAQENQSLKADKQIDYMKAETDRIKVMGDLNKGDGAQAAPPQETLPEATKMQLDATLKDQLAANEAVRTNEQLVLKHQLDQNAVQDTADLAGAMQMMMEQMTRMHDMIAAPRKKTLMRDDKGRATHAIDEIIIQGPSDNEL
jgi:hypothetical protein